jgi:hypothetical protein
MINKLSVIKERSQGAVSQRSPKATERKNFNNKFLRSAFKKLNEDTKNINNKIDGEKSEKNSKELKKIKKEERTESPEPSCLEVKTVLPLYEKNILSVATNLVRDIFTGLNASGNRELILSMSPSIFKNTWLRVERTGRARVRIIIDSDDPVALNFFNNFSENIKAGLAMRGLILDEFKINR